MTRSAAAPSRQGFAAQFGRPPQGVWSSPGRVTLIGDHTDHQGGARTAVRHRPSHARRRGRRAPTACCAWRRRSVPGEMLASRRWRLLPAPAAGPPTRSASASSSTTRASPPSGADLWIDSTRARRFRAVVQRRPDLRDRAGPARPGGRRPPPRPDRPGRAARRDRRGRGPRGSARPDRGAVRRARVGAAHRLRPTVADPLPPSPCPAPPWQLAVVDTRVRHSHAAGGYADRRRLLDQARQRLGVGSLSGLDPAGLAGQPRRIWTPTSTPRPATSSARTRGCGPPWPRWPITTSPRSAS